MLKLAWRNIWRNRRRTLITAAAIGGGVAGLMWGQSFSLSFQRRYIESSISFFVGDLRIESTKVRDARLPDQDIERPKEIEDALAADPNVKDWAERVIFTGLVGSPRASIGVTVFGVQPEREGSVNEVLHNVVQGSSTPAPGNSVVIGKLLAQDLGVGLGDKIVLIGQAVNGELGAEPFRVVGLFSTGSVLFDSKLVLAPIQPVQTMLYKEGRVTDFIADVRDVDQVGRVKAALADRLSKRDDVRVLAWNDIDKETQATCRWLNWTYKIILRVILCLATLGILNAMLMSILERTREFGVLKAVGAQPWTLAKLVVLECALVGALGSLFGCLIGAGIIAFYKTAGLAIPIAESMAYTAPFDKVLFFHFFWADHLTAVVEMLAASFVAGVLPACVVYRVKISDALRDL